VVHRVVVVGVSGNGKTTLSRQLAAKLAVPHVELDALNHLPGWVESSVEDFRRDVEAAMDRTDCWVFDGSYQNKLGDLILRRANTLVWLDQPLLLVLRRLVTRAVRDIVTKRDLFNGNRQSWRFAFWGRDSLVGFAIRMYFQRRREWPGEWEPYDNLEVVRLRSPHEVERWLGCQAPD
jgi:adenylate kinase family enzyme